MLCYLNNYLVKNFSRQIDSKNLAVRKIVSISILHIDLTNNQSDQSSFALSSLINFKRPTKLYLMRNQIKYLKEVFKPFLNANKLNTIEID